MLDEARAKPWHEEVPRAKLRHAPASGQPASVCAEESETARTSVARLHRRLVVAVDAADGSVGDLRKAHVACDRLEEAAAELRSHAVLITAPPRGRQPLASTEAPTSLAPDPQPSR